MEHVVIIGNGIAGVTAARHIRKLSDKKITIISSEASHFFSRTALMYVYMGHMRWKDIEPYEPHFWKKNRIDLIQDYVTRVHTKEKKLDLEKGQPISYDILILATGSTTRTFDWPGLNFKGVQGLVTKQDLENLEQNAPNKDVCRRAVIVGGGLIGVELAEMLRTRDIEVSFLVREGAFWTGTLPLPEAKMLSEHIASHGVDMQHHTELKEILGDDEGNVRAVVTNKGTEIPCDLVGITTGVTPNIKFLETSDIETDRGILVNEHLETNIPNVYAIGDCAQQRNAIGKRPPVEAVWYTGRIMGKTVAQTLCGNPTTYQPGHWFNSAKFFDIEYQTYGWVFSEKKKSEDEVHFHWKHPNKEICITFAYHRRSREFLGVNTFGIRMRHEVFDRWLQEKRSIDEVIQHLSQANFDPEFYTQYHSLIQKKFMTNATITA
tara:strand:- start:44855 stop:46159 length:1305 start_codon:yes stop_codon:yes gene_type:complete